MSRRKLATIIAVMVVMAAVAGSATYFMQSGARPPVPTTLSLTIPSTSTPAAVPSSSSKIPRETYRINQKGSDTLLVLAQRWAEAYMSENPEARIAVSGGGSGTGIAALINKQIDLADASRPVKPEEINDAEANGVYPVEWRVAVDGIAVIVHRSNPLNGLTLTQLKAIYNGTFKNWQDVGGSDAPIVTYGRQSNSGTYIYWQEHVLMNQNYRTDMQALNGNSDVADAISRDPNGIGYVGVAYASARGGDVKMLSIQERADKPAYYPTAENIVNGEYPISRYLFVYTDGVPIGGVKEYLKFIIGDEGQQVVEEAQYIPLPREVRQEQLAKLS